MNLNFFFGYKVRLFEDTNRKKKPKKNTQKIHNSIVVFIYQIGIQFIINKVNKKYTKPIFGSNSSRKCVLNRQRKVSCWHFF